jgi:type I restriction enzyme R subunit
LSNAEQKSALAGRKALEWLTEAIYYVNRWDKPERATLFELVDSEQFKQYLHSADLLRCLHYIRKEGNAAAHGRGLTRREAFFSLLNLYNFVGAVMVQWGVVSEVAPFRKDLIPKKPEMHVVPEDEHPDKDEIQHVYPEAPRKPLIVQEPTTDIISEAETRSLFIDQMLREAGWEICEVKHAIVPDKACIEVEVEGMPSPSGKGYADYVLFGHDGTPLAVIEAKQTSLDAKKGRQQAELYAACLEKRYGVKPVIYYTNGFTTKVIDRLGYRDREVMSFHSQNDLQLLRERQHRQRISDMRANPEIAGRPYQMKAVTAVCERLNNRRRRALIVMATGTGKTRVAIAITEVLLRNNWIKHVLFLADRTSLVDQAEKSFVKLLPSATTASLLDEQPDLDARVLFSTYQTMIGYIDKDEKDFSIGRFDLIFIDEAHRSVFGKYGTLFDYFDSLLIGMTATPREEVERSTFDLLEEEGGEPTADYTYDEAIRDKYLCPFKLLDCTTPMLKRGIPYNELSKEQQEQLEDVWKYEKAKQHLDPDSDYSRDIDKKEINRYIYNTGTADTVLQTLMEQGLRIEDNSVIGKTIIFAVDHHHAEIIVDEFRKLYPEYSPDFCQLIDYSLYDAKDLIEKFKLRGKHEPQIAVSVDMLDTGIDVPDVLNLVFFKPVGSKIRFYQMIGRGTRLSADIFGPGKDKKEFYIFDWCGNFTFFSEHAEGVEPVPMVSLEERLFGLSLDIAVVLQDAKYQQDAFAKSLHDDLKDHLCAEVASLKDSSIAVRKQWALVFHYKKRESWHYVSETQALELKEKVAPLLPCPLEDYQAKRFDILMLKIELGLIDEAVNAESAENKVYQVVKMLSEKASIPQVLAKMRIINEVLSEEFWQDKSLQRLEHARKELRDLMQFLTGEHGKTFVINIDDPLDSKMMKEPAITGYPSYKERVIDWLTRNEPTNKVLQKIRNLEQLDEADIHELERILWEELGSKEEYQQNVEGRLCGGNVAAFIRSIIKVDRQTALEKFEKLLQTEQLNASQMDVLETIINYVCENGDISRQTMSEEPFSQYPWQEIFGDKLSFVPQYVGMLHEVINDNKQIS